MRFLVQPELNIRDIIDACTSNLRNGKEKYTSALPQIKQYSELFDEKMHSNNAWTLSPHKKVTDDLTKDDMVALYENKFAKQGQPGRKYYDIIKIAPKNNICPICGIGDVSTLDHYMAKSEYPTLAVTPTNLIPACRDCNTIRGTKIFDEVADMTLHPYYDDLRNIEWLAARVISRNPICVEYYVSNTYTNQPMRSRLEKHLEVFDLRRRYSLKAAEELSSIRNIIKMLLANGGPTTLIGYFELQYQSHYSNEINSWKTAFYRALREIAPSLSTEDVI